MLISEIDKEKINMMDYMIYSGSEFHIFWVKNLTKHSVDLYRLTLDFRDNKCKIENRDIHVTDSEEDRNRLYELEEFKENRLVMIFSRIFEGRR